MNLCVVARAAPQKNLQLSMQYFLACDVVDEVILYTTEGYQKFLSEDVLSRITIKVGQRVRLEELKRWDVLFSTGTIGEGFQNIILESIVAGLIPVSFDAGSANEIILDKRLICNTDLDGVRSSLKHANTILLDLKAKECFRAVHLAHIKRLYSIERVAETYARTLGIL